MFEDQYPLPDCIYISESSIERGLGEKDQNNHRTYAFGDIGMCISVCNNPRGNTRDDACPAEGTDDHCLH